MGWDVDTPPITQPLTSACAIIGSGCPITSGCPIAREPQQPQSSGGHGQLAGGSSGTVSGVSMA